MGKGKADFARTLNEEPRSESVQHYIASALEFMGTLGRFIRSIAHFLFRYPCTLVIIPTLRLEIRSCYSYLQSDHWMLPGAVTPQKRRPVIEVASGGQWRQRVRKEGHHLFYRLLYTPSTVLNAEIADALTKIYQIRICKC
jgi:hypothetical protein